MRDAVARLMLVLGLLVGSIAPSQAGEAKADPNEATVGVLSGTPEQLALVLRFARAMDHANGLRILPMAGKGPVQTLTDLLYLKGVDAALVASDTLAFMERNGLAKDLGGKLSYVVRLSSLDVHVIARTGIDTISDLAGKTVAIGSTASGSYVAGQFLLAAAGLAAKTIEADGAEAIRAVTDGTADAAILVGLKPLPELRLITAASGLHLLAVTAPEGLQETYAPSLITQEDYPQLVTAGHPVETISASLVVAVFNWKRGSPQYGKLKRFADELLAALQPGGGNDASLNLAATVPGWTRHPVAEEALTSHAEKLHAATQSTPEN